MSQTTLSNMTMRTRPAEKPGLFPAWLSGRDTRKGSVPLAITLPLTMAVSFALWAGLFMAIRALFW
jgi:hypothetical protein